VQVRAGRPARTASTWGALAAAVTTSSADQLKQYVDTLEEAYEFCLAYAAQGVSGESGRGGQVREYLNRADAALNGLADLFLALVEERNLQPLERYRRFLDVLRQDASAAQAAIQMVLAQPAVSSPLIDNLNASIHLRALLTDVFIIDEILRPQIARADTPRA